MEGYLEHSKQERKQRLAHLDYNAVKQPSNTEIKYHLKPTPVTVPSQKPVQFNQIPPQTTYLPQNIGAKGNNYDMSASEVGRMVKTAISAAIKTALSCVAGIFLSGSNFRKNENCELSKIDSKSNPNVVNDYKNCTVNINSGNNMTCTKNDNSTHYTNNMTRYDSAVQHNANNTEKVLEDMDEMDVIMRSILNSMLSLKILHKGILNSYRKHLTII